VSPWADFLSAAEPSTHGVQVYADPGELADSVASYLAAGFEAGECGVVVATREHRRLFTERLRDRGVDADALVERGSLVLADAQATLDAITVDGMPSATAFETVVGELLDRAAAPLFHRHVRVVGEMVDLLTREGRHEAAAALEDLWNRLARTRTFSLLCGYSLDVFDRDAQLRVLPGVCRTHSHVLPAADGDRLARAVDRALEDVLGPDEAGKVYVLVGERMREGRVPAPQLVLMWLSEQMPVLAGRVLASARAHHAAA
jgi:hypothetical protein